MNRGVLIIGGGIIGLSVGWLLARRKERVLILERGGTGQESSWAAAGMLSPLCELEVDGEEVYQLGLASLRLYPDFVRELEAASGERVGFRNEGTLQVALDADERQQLERIFKRQQGQRDQVRWLSGEEAQMCEDGLSPRVVAGIKVDDYQVDNRRLMATLRRAFLSAGGELREHCEVQELLPQGDEAPAVQVEGEVLLGKQVLLAAGCWSRMIKGVDSLVDLPVRPIKGQMLCLRAPQHEIPKRVLHGVRYGYCLVPREDGRVLIGASVEERGFDKQSSAGVLFDLLREARRIFPRVDEWPLEEVWAGLRPGSRDNAPIVGRIAPGFFVATGHYRNGILNAPITAHSLVSLMLDNECPSVIKPFSATRFRAKTG